MADLRAHVRGARGTRRARRLRPRTPARTPWRRGGERLNHCAVRFILAGSSLHLAATPVQAPCKRLHGRQGARMQACIYERMVHSHVWLGDQCTTMGKVGVPRPGLSALSRCQVKDLN